MSSPTEAELEFVDDVAVFFAREGLPLIAGRVVGWLLISDPPEQSAAELADVLRVSRSSISSATRLLTPSGLVEGVRRRGERQEYFRIAADGWSRMVAIRYAKTAAFRELTEVGLRVLAGSAPERRERLAGVHQLYQFLEQELPALWERWEAYRTATEATTDATADASTDSDASASTGAGAGADKGAK
ncbi:GbsR/MarR family transcriptional regulator [Nonomuraea mesophila]|uniref:GbsR/MarR family transcriptional regulator n=1 Tax=Nonomuraea mesophila TaxID=2530382 RepID=UPI00140871AC|nr:MarR family transcriptional regulator [Nonomuraea mesophila]